MVGLIFKSFFICFLKIRFMQFLAGKFLNCRQLTSDLNNLISQKFTKDLEYHHKYPLFSHKHLASLIIEQKRHNL